MWSLFSSSFMKVSPTWLAFSSSFSLEAFHALVLADEVSPLFFWSLLLLFLSFSFFFFLFFSLFFRGSFLLGERLFLLKASWRRITYMDRIKVETRNERQWGVCGMPGEEDAIYSIWMMHTKHDVVEASNAKLNEGNNQPKFCHKLKRFIICKNSTKMQAW